MSRHHMVDTSLALVDETRGTESFEELSKRQRPYIMQYARLATPACTASQPKNTLNSSKQQMFHFSRRRVTSIECRWFARRNALISCKFCTS